MDHEIPFKDRNATREAWRQFCCKLAEEFKEMESKEKNQFEKAVTKRWGNLRDAFSKSKRKLSECKKSGAGASNIKKYVYADQMNFLDKLYQFRQVAESLEDSTTVTADRNADDEQFQQSFVQKNNVPVRRKEDNSRENATGCNKRRRTDEVDLKILKALEQPTPSSHMSFFQGLLPHLNKCNDAEVLEFQIDVLQVISKINAKRNSDQPLPSQTHSYHHQNYPYPGPPSFPRPHPPSLYSYSNQFVSNSQAPFSQTNQFHNPQNLNYSNTINQQACSSQRPKKHESQREQSTAQSYPPFGQSLTSPSPDHYLTDISSPPASISSNISTDNTYDSTYDFP